MSAPVKARPSVRVCKMFEHGLGSPLADGLAAVSWWYYRHRAKDVDVYRFVDVYAGDRHVQISISPAGRSVRVFVDNIEVKA